MDDPISYEEKNREESTGIGLDNIRGMMEKMGGSAEAGAAGKTFTVQLLFRTVS